MGEVCRVTSLTRGEHHVERGAAAVRRLLRVVGAWGPDTCLDVTSGAAGRAGNQVTFAVAGRVPQGWADDLRWALDTVATLAPAVTRAGTVPAHVGELRAIRDVPTAALASETDAADTLDPSMVELRRQRVVRALTPWPQPQHADLGDLLGLNLDVRGRPGVVVRHRISAATSLEQEMARDRVQESWDHARGSLHDYLGAPVRLRTLVGVSSGSMPARVQAIVHQWGSFLELDHLGVTEAAQAWDGAPVDLAGHVVPLGVALALVRLPAAGDRPFPGLRSTEPPVRMAPIDPLPSRPRRPIRLGRARTAEGRWTEVMVDLADLTQHAFVQGASGSRKTTLLASMAVAVQQAGGSYTYLAEASGVDAVLRSTHEDHAARTRVIRHGDARLDVPINVLAVEPRRLEKVIALWAEMIQQAQDPRREGIVGPRWTRYFTLIALNAVAHLGADATLVAVARIAGDIKRVRALAEATSHTHADISHALMSEYGRLNEREAVELTSWGASKFQELLSSDAIRWTLGCGPDAINVADAMDTGTSLLVDLAAHELGPTAARAIGATHLLKHWAALGERRHRDRVHVILVDEAHLFSYGPLPRLLAEARKFGVGVVVATQHLGQLTGELSDALESNTGTFVSLRSGLESAKRASAKLMGWTASELVRLPNGVAASTMSRDGVVTAPFSLEVDFFDRTRRLARQGLVGDHVASQIEALSHENLSGRFRALEPMSDAELVRRLEAVKRPPNQLDDWISQRSPAGRG